MAMFVLASAVTSCSAGAAVFSDATFNLADYSQARFLDNQMVTISTAQTPTGGNPGSGLEIVVDVPPMTVFASMQGFANDSFTYDPATQGVLATIDASVDKVFNTDLNLASNFFRPLILQGGNYYTASIALAATKNVWLAGSQTGLHASDFTLFNFTTGSFDTTAHPDFAGGLMTFGIVNRLTQTSSASPNHDDILYDNFTLDLHAASADFDGDGDVDGADFLRWQHGLGVASGATLSQGDANGDGAVTASDLAIWRNQFGQDGSSTLHDVPEPHCHWLAFFGMTLGVYAHRRCANRHPMHRQR